MTENEYAANVVRLDLLLLEATREGNTEDADEIRKTRKGLDALRPYDPNRVPGR